MESQAPQNLITPPGYKKLAEEYHFLKTVERPRIVEEVHFAAKQGDRSENAEYQYGKKRLREIDRRVRFLTKRMENARIIEPKEQKPDKIRFGATVELIDENEFQKIFFDQISIFYLPSEGGQSSYFKDRLYGYFKFNLSLSKRYQRDSNLNCQSKRRVC